MRTENGLIVEVRDRVGYVTIDRPERLNALSTGVQRDLVDAFDAMSFDDEVWAVALTGSGDRAFSAGVDLKEIGAADGSKGGGLRQPMTGAVRNVFETVLECAKPTVAVLNGWAMGGGCELALACDLRIASDDTRIGMPEAKRGMGANFGAQLLPRIVPLAVAYEMLYLGEALTAEEAQRWGLVNRVVPKAELAAFAETYVRALCQSAPLTVRRYKAVISRGRDMPVSAALRLNAGPNPYLSEDRVEGVAAFNQKRPPVWRAR